VNAVSRIIDDKFTNSQSVHVTHCHFGDSSKLESREIFKTHPPEEPLKIAPQPRVQVAAFRPVLRHGGGGEGPRWVTLDCKLPVGRLYMQAQSALGVYITTRQSTYWPQHVDYACGGSFLGTEAPQCIAAGRTSTTGVFERPASWGEKGDMGG